MPSGRAIVKFVGFPFLPGPQSACGRSVLRTCSVLAPARLSAPDPVLYVSTPVCRGAVANAHLGLA